VKVDLETLLQNEALDEEERRKDCADMDLLLVKLRQGDGRGRNG
jgi:hypothetical protein